MILFVDFKTSPLSSVENIRSSRIRFALKFLLLRAAEIDAR